MKKAVEYRPSLIVEEARLAGLLLPLGALAALALPARRRTVELPLLSRLLLQVAVDLWEIEYYLLHDF